MTREIGQSLFLMAIFAAVNGTVLGLGLLVVQVLG